MTDPRTLAAAVLGVGLGLVMLVSPATIVRVQLAGRVPTDRHGEYGTDDPPARWLLAVRVLGGVVLLAGVYFGALAAGI